MDVDALGKRWYTAGPKPDGGSVDVKPLVVRHKGTGGG